MLVNSVRQTEQKAAQHWPIVVHRKLEKQATQSALDFSDHAIQAASEDFFSNPSFRAKEKGLNLTNSSSVKESSSSNDFHKAHSTSMAGELSSNPASAKATAAARDSSNRSHQSFESIPEEEVPKDSGNPSRSEKSCNDPEDESSFLKEERDSSSTNQASKSSQSANFGDGDNDDKEQPASKGDSLHRIRMALDCGTEKEEPTKSSCFMNFKPLRDVRRSGWRGSRIIGADMEGRRERRKALRMTRVVTGRAF